MIIMGNKVCRIVDLDEKRVTTYLIETVEGFLNDPPDSEFQYGYLAAILTVWKEAFASSNCDQDARYLQAMRLLRARGITFVEDKKDG